MPRVVRKPSSRSPPRVVSHLSDPVYQQARDSDSGSLSSFSREAERQITEGHEAEPRAEGGRDLNISQRGSVSSSDDGQRQPVNLLPVFQKPLYVQLPGSSGAIVELI